MWLPSLGHVRCCDRCCDQDWSWIQSGSEEAQKAEKAAMQAEGVAVILNIDHDAPIEGTIFGGEAWTHTWFSSSMWLAANPGQIALAKAAPGAEGQIVFIPSADLQKEPQQLEVGGFYRWDSQECQMVTAEQPRVARGAFLHFEKIQATASELKCVVSMLAHLPRPVIYCMWMSTDGAKSRKQDRAMKRRDSRWSSGSRQITCLPCAANTCS